MPALDETLRKALGGNTAKVMADHLGLRTVGDLLHHYPRRYAERGELTRLADLPLDEHVTVVARVADARMHRFNRGRSQRLEVTLTDGSGQLQLVFFGRGAHAPQQKLLPGRRGMFAGKVGVFNRRLQLAHPQYELLADEDDPAQVDAFANRLLPIYPACAQLPSWKVEKAVDTLLRTMESEGWRGLVDPLPESIRAGRSLIALPEALTRVHRPSGKADVVAARSRLKWDEAFVLQTALARRRMAETQLAAEPRAARAEGLLEAFDARLPFTLTDGQRRVSGEISGDLGGEHPMHRLLQGEVGSGKAQPLDAQVLTPGGFRPMGELLPGDEVVTPGGEVVPVEGVFPQGERHIWRLVLSDDTTVECDDDHLWLVGTRRAWQEGQPPRTLTTRELRHRLTTEDGSPQWFLPCAAPVDLGGDQPRPLDPYLLGTLLGGAPLDRADGPEEAAPRGGCRGGERAEPEPPHTQPTGLGPLTAQARPGAVDARHGAPGAGGHRHGPLPESRRTLPEGYRNAPVKDRLAVLQGLFDTAGTVDRRGTGVELRHVTRTLAEDAAWLVRSLGGHARVALESGGPPPRPAPEAPEAARAACRVRGELPAGHPPFRLAPHAARPRPHGVAEALRRAVLRVEYVGRKPAQCISVRHPSRAYVTDGFTVTHNTMVALRAMLTVVDSGGQAALLAPTEVLAQQHHRSVTEMMGELAEGGTLGAGEQATRVVLLTGSMGAAVRRRALLELTTGEAGIVVGTHALIEDRVIFHDLGLVVVDEQHRFGVEQRDALRSKGRKPPHLLVMTATPIPRTVAMTVFGDLETSVLDELPAGRSPIASHVVPAKEKPRFVERVWERVREEAEAGHQTYVVCPRIGDEVEQHGQRAARPAPGDQTDSEPSAPETGADASPQADADAEDADAEDADAEDADAEDADAEDAEEKRPPLAVLDVAARLSEGPLSGLRVEALHGRMPPEEKDETMRRFAAGEVDVLVATTVIEVGVNVPNATTMVIMDADRFGVSQLHQLRGRVGRGSAPGLCLLVSDMPQTSPARARLDAVAGTGDGFELSRIDLEQRREGDVLGQAQSGARTSLRMLTVVEDEDVIAAAREEATAVVSADPELEHHPQLRTALSALLDEEREEFLDKG